MYVGSYGLNLLLDCNVFMLQTLYDLCYAMLHWGILHFEVSCFITSFYGLIFRTLIGNLLC